MSLFSRGFWEAGPLRPLRGHLPLKGEDIGVLAAVLGADVLRWTEDCSAHVVPR